MSKLEKSQTLPLANRMKVVVAVIVIVIVVVIVVVIVFLVLVVGKNRKYPIQKRRKLISLSASYNVNIFQDLQSIVFVKCDQHFMFLTLFE